VQDVSKVEFAELMGVSHQRVSQWLRDQKIDGAALIGAGRSARIRVEVAKAQLDSRLDLGQRLGANGKALLDGVELHSADAAIKGERLAQLRHLNAKAAEEAELRRGRYVLADDVRLEMGAIAGRTVSTLESGLPSLANAIADQFQLPPRDVLHTLRASWHAIRGRLAASEPLASVREPKSAEASP
jgi:transcriptional regulator with XRE-family HTH domain